MATVSGEQIALKKMQLAGWLYLFVIVAVSAIVFSLNFALSVLAGGIISLLSFMASYKELMGLLEKTASWGDEKEKDTGQRKAAHPKRGFLVRFWIRIAVIGVVLFMLIKSGMIHVFGLIIGLSTAVFTVMVTSLSMARHQVSNGRR